MSLYTRFTAHLDAVLDALEASWSKGHAAAVCLTPHYRTLIDPHDRQEYFARLKALPEHLHKVIERHCINIEKLWHLREAI